MSGPRLVVGLNDLATVFPDLARELVGTDPTSVHVTSNRRLTWCCPAHGHQYAALVSNRAGRRRTGCPYCTNRRVLAGFNDMATTHPALAAELIGDDPTTVLASTGRQLEWRCPAHGGTYRTSGALRVRGSGCPYCARGGATLPGRNDLATTHPELAAELVGDATQMRATSKTPQEWKCPARGHIYRAAPMSRLSGAGCPYCSGQRVLVGFNDLATTHPEVAASVVGDATEVTAGSARALLWRCPNHAAPFAMRVSHRVAGAGCSYCAGKKVLPGYNDLATTHPALAEQLLGVDPTTVSAGSARAVRWRDSLGHEWSAVINNRAGNGTGCPYCSTGNPRVLVGFNDLATTHPDLARQVVAPDDPTTFTAGSGRMVRWYCPNHPEPFLQPPATRVRGADCGFCAGRRLLVGYNDLLTRRPEIGRELVDVDPTTLMWAGSQRVLWRCSSCGHEWWQTPSQRTSAGHGCPACSSGGFDPSRPAVVYLMERPGEQQVGITGGFARRSAFHGLSGWTPRDVLGPMPGARAAEIETRIKTWLRTNVGTIAGTTENWSTAVLEVPTVLELCRRAGLADPYPAERD